MVPLFHTVEGIRRGANTWELFGVLTSYTEAVRHKAWVEQFCEGRDIVIQTNLQMPTILEMMMRDRLGPKHRGCLAASRASAAAGDWMPVRRTGLHDPGWPIRPYERRTSRTVFSVQRRWRTELSVRPVTMTVKHDPANGTFGDCFRCCVASLLELHPAQVPHFYEDGDTVDHDVQQERIDKFLERFGIYALCFRVKPTDPIFDGLRGHYILSGISPRGFRHAVVAKGRCELVHDPHPTEPAGVVPDDGEFMIEVFFKLL